jgi:hypothetical protein
MVKGAIPLRSTLPGCFLTQMRECAMNRVEYLANKPLERGIHSIVSSARSRAMAPICEHCQCKVIGHGVEVEGRFFCCAHCARLVTSADVKDRAA